MYIYMYTYEQKKYRSFKKKLLKRRENFCAFCGPYISSHTFKVGFV